MLLLHSFSELGRSLGGGAAKASVEVLRGKLGGDRADLEDKLVPIGANRRDR